MGGILVTKGQKELDGQKGHVEMWTKLDLRAEQRYVEEKEARWGGVKKKGVR